MLHNITGKHEEEEDKRTESLKEYITGKHWTHFRPFQMQKTASASVFKLYYRYKYTRLCMINLIWGIKTTMTTSEWICLVSFAWLS